MIIRLPPNDVPLRNHFLRGSRFRTKNNGQKQDAFARCLQQPCLSAVNLVCSHSFLVGGCLYPPVVLGGGRFPGDSHGKSGLASGQAAAFREEISPCQRSGWGKRSRTGFSSPAQKIWKLNRRCGCRYPSGAEPLSGSHRSWHRRSGYSPHPFHRRRSRAHRQPQPFPTAPGQIPEKSCRRI